MYFAVSWSEPRLRINQTAAEWTEARTGPTNVGVTASFPGTRIHRTLSRR